MLYHYRVSSTNATGQSTVSADNSFITPDLPPPPAPLLTAISVSWTNPAKALIVWTTDQAANSTVEWGIDTGYGSTTNNAALLTAHSICISNLAPSTLYHYRVSSTNATGQSAVSADNSFITPDLPVPAPLLSAISVVSSTPTTTVIVLCTAHQATYTTEGGINAAYDGITNN